jgi:hypothetical protein
MKAMSNEDLWTAEREVIEIAFPGSVEFVVIARFTAATIGARAGFDLNEIDDLRLAVDELSISFGPLNADSCLRYEFMRDGDTVMVRCAREPAQGHVAGVRQGGGPGPMPEIRLGRSERDLANWLQARELSAVLLDELVTSHGREIDDGRSVAWLMKRRGEDVG